MNRQTAKYRDFVLLALFAAIILLLAFTPIGYIQLPIIKATIVHVPVIPGAIVLGPKKGAILGVLFGLTSFISNTFMPTALSFAFSPAIRFRARRTAAFGVCLSVLSRVFWWGLWRIMYLRCSKS